MRDTPTPASIRAYAAVGCGLLALGMGLSMRGVGFARSPGSVAGLFAISALVLFLCFANMPKAWPRYHRFPFMLPWVGAAFLSVIMIALALFAPDLRGALVPAALETAGGIALLVGATRWGEAAIIRRHRWPHIDGQSKSEVHHDGGASALVPASALVADDDVRLQSGDEIPADGRLCSEQATVDEVAVMGRSRPAEKREGAPVFAGTRAMSPLRLRVAAPWQDSWAAQRDRRHDELMAIHVESDRPGRAAASALTLLAVSMAGLAMTRAGPMAIDLWLPTVAAMLMATIAVGPSFGRMRGRIALLHSLHRAGALLSRARDLRVLASARQWYLDPRLLATTGPVDVVALNEASPEELMVVAEALLRGRGGATHESLWAAIARKGLRPSPGASLEWTDDLLSGSLDGQRWFFGRVGQVQEKLGFALSDAQAGLIRGFEDRALTPWLIGREGEGLFGAIGVAVQADPAVARAAVELQARVIASIPEASMLAEQAALPCGEDPGPRDATLMYERTEAPRAGMRVRVLEPRAALRLPRAGAPRIMRPAVERFGGALVAARTYRGAARRNAWLVTGAGMLTAAAVGLLAALPPFAGVAIGLVVLRGTIGRPPVDLTPGSTSATPPISAAVDDQPRLPEPSI